MLAFFEGRIHYNFENGCALSRETPEGADATILHPRFTPFRYPSLIRRSDTIFAKNFKRRVVIDNDPSLYIRFYHGLNLWDANHIMMHLGNPKTKGRLEVNPEHKILLKNVLKLYDGWANDDCNEK